MRISTLPARSLAWYWRTNLAVLAGVAKFVETFAAFPPAQHPDSFTPTDALDKLRATGTGD